MGRFAWSNDELAVGSDEESTQPTDVELVASAATVAEVLEPTADVTVPAEPEVVATVEPAVVETAEPVVVETAELVDPEEPVEAEEESK